MPTPSRTEFQERFITNQVKSMREMGCWSEEAIAREERMLRSMTVTHNIVTALFDAAGGGLK